MNRHDLPRHVTLALATFAVAGAWPTAVGSGASSDETSKQDVLRQTRQAFEAADRYSEQRVNELQEAVKSDLAEARARLDRMRGNVTEKTAEAKEAAKKRVEAIEKSLRELEGETDKLKSATAESWASIRKAFSSAMTEFKRTYEKETSK